MPASEWNRWYVLFCIIPIIIAIIALIIFLTGPL